MQIPINQRTRAQRHEERDRADADVIYAPIDDEEVDETPGMDPGDDAQEAYAHPQTAPAEDVSDDPTPSQEPMPAEPDGAAFGRTEGASAPEQAAPAEDPADPFAETGDVDDVEDLVETVPKDDYDALQARYDRMMADWDNYRRRSAEELESARALANRNIVEALLPTIDNFALAIAHAAASDDEATKGMMRGFDAIYRGLLSQLQREGMEITSPAIGDAFDMTSHQAVARKEGSDMEPDRISAVVQPGYSFKGAIIRPAMVEVTV